MSNYSNRAAELHLRRHENGNICCVQYDTDGEPLVPKVDARCDRCKAHFATLELRASLKTQESIMDNDYTPPDPYAPHPAQLSAAQATPLSTFEDRWKAERTAEFEAEWQEADAFRAAQPAPERMSAEDVKQYSPPDPYAAALAAPKEQR
jgi:hypothetical protein